MARANQIMVCLALEALLCVGPEAQGTVYVWDTSDQPGFQAGTGTWGAASADAFWSLDGSAGQSRIAWAAGNSVLFLANSNPSSDITVSGTVSVDTVTFSGTGYTIAGGTLNLWGGAVTATADASIASALIPPPSGLVKDGTGVLTLRSPRINYSAPTTIAAGTLKLEDTTSFAKGNSATSLAIAQNATLEIAVSDGVQWDMGSNAPGGIAISGSGNFVKSGLGQLSFGNQGAAGYRVRFNLTGLIDLQGGRLLNGGWQGGVWSNNRASLHIAAGATLDLWDGNPVQVDALSGAGQVTCTGYLADQYSQICVGVAGGSGVYDGTLDDYTGGGFGNSGPGTRHVTLIKRGGGEQVLNNPASTFAGGLWITGGTLTASSIAADNSPSALGAGGEIWLSTGTLRYTGGNAVTNRPFFIEGSDTPNHPAGGIEVVAPAATLELTGTFTSGATWGTTSWVKKTGPGTLVVSAPGSDDLSVIVDQGTLVLNGDQSKLVDNPVVNTGATLKLAGTSGDQIYDGGAVTLKPGGALDMNGRNETIAALAGSGTAPAVLTLGGHDRGGEVNAALADGTAPLGLRKIGAGEVLLANANAYSGKTIIEGGVVRLNQDAGLGTLPYTPQDDNVTLDGGGIKANSTSLTLHAKRGIFLGPGGGYLTAGWGLGPGSGDNRALVVNGRITGPGTLRINRYGSPVVLTAPANDYAGDTVIGAMGPGWYPGPAAWLQLGASNVLPHGPGRGNVLVSGENQGVLDLNGHAQTVNALGGAGQVINLAAAPATLTVGDTGANSVFGGAIQGTVTLEKIGAGVLVLSGANAYSGPTRIQQGTLRLAPLPVPGASLWLSARSGVGADEAGMVAQWSDFSGYGRGARQDDPWMRPAPAARDGRPVLRFDGSRLLYVDLSFLANSDYTVFAIEARSDGGDNNYYLGAGAGVAPGRAVYFGYRYGSEYTSGHGANDLDCLVPPYDAPTLRMWTNVLEVGNRRSIFLDGVDQPTFPGDGAGDTSPLAAADLGQIGGGPSYAQTLYRGDLGEIIAYNRALGPAERSAVEAYLRHRWFGGPAPVLPNVLPAGTAVEIAAGAALDLNGASQTVASLADSGPAGGRVVSAADGPLATLTLDVAGGKASFSGPVEGNIRLKKTGPGTQSLSGVNTYGGGTEVAEGVLEIAGPYAVPSGGALVIGRGATVVFAPDLVLNGTKAAATAVPEPGTLAILAAGTWGAALLIMRCRRVPAAKRQLAGNDLRSRTSPDE